MSAAMLGLEGPSETLESVELELKRGVRKGHSKGRGGVQRPKTTKALWNENEFKVNLKQIVCKGKH